MPSFKESFDISTVYAWGKRVSVLLVLLSFIGGIAFSIIYKVQVSSINRSVNQIAEGLDIPLIDSIIGIDRETKIITEAFTGRDSYPILIRTLAKYLASNVSISEATISGDVKTNYTLKATFIADTPYAYAEQIDIFTQAHENKEPFASGSIAQVKLTPTLAPEGVEFVYTLQNITAEDIASMRSTT